MKRVIISFILGFVAAMYYFTGELTLNKETVKLKSFNVDQIMSGVSDVTSELLSLIPSLISPQEDIEAVGQELLNQIQNLNEEDALKLINETLKNMGDSLTPEEQAALQDKVTQYYKEKVLQQYKDSLGTFQFE